MNRRLIIPVLLLMLGGASHNAWAQNIYTDQNAKMLDECRTLFSQGDYRAAGMLLDNLARISPASVNRTEEIDYMRTVIETEREAAGAMPTIQAFMERYPNSIYSNRMTMQKGISHMARYEFKEAVESFDECDPLLLEEYDMKRFVRYYAISLLRSGDIEEGSLQLGILEELADDPEVDPDIVFYQSYLDYRKGKYVQARDGFEYSLSTNHAEEASLYLADMDLRTSKDNKLAFETANRIVEDSRDPMVEAEAERILGEYWYRNGDYEQAQYYLTSYLTFMKSPDERHDNYLLGMSCYMNGYMDSAIKHLSGVSEGEDEMAQNAALHLGLAALAKDDKSMARMAFERASNLPGSLAVREQALYNYAMVIHETSFSPFAESVTAFERFLNEFPGSEYTDKVNSYLIDVYLNTNSYDAALASIAKIKNPGSAILAAKMQLLFNKAMDRLAAADYQEVPSILTEVIILDRYDHALAVEATFWRGETYYRMGQTDMAENDYRRYLTLSGNKVSLSSALANYGLGYILYNRQKYKDAFSYFKQVTTGTRRSGISSDILANASLRAGDCMFHEKDYAEAKDYYNMAMNSDNRTGDYALYQTALVNGLQRNYQQKIKDLDRLVRDYPQSSYVPSALYEQGRAYQQTDKPTQAIVAFKRIISEYPNSDLARKASAETALIYYQTEKYDDAIKAYKDVISRYPGSDEARTAMVDLKSIYVETGDINSYVEFTRTVQGATPVAVSERDSLTYAAAESAFGRGDKDQALVRFRQYIEQFPDGAFAANAWYYQAQLYEERSDPDNALDCFIHAASFENSRFSESAIDHAAVIYWDREDWKPAKDMYLRLYEKTFEAERKRRSLYAIVISSANLKETDDILKYADKALQTQLTADQKTEVMYWKAKSLLSKGDNPQARTVLEDLSKDTRSKYGAEADFLLSQLLFDSGDMEGAEKVIMEFIKEGTPHMYWLARSFILLSDIYKSQGKEVEARQYLLSLKSNYTENDDIAQMIADRLE